MSSELAQSMQECSADGPVMVQITKLYHTTDAQSFRAFGRVISGTLRKGMDVKVLGEGYSPEDEEDMVKAQVEDLWISESRWVHFETLCATCALQGVTGTSFQQRKSLQVTSCWSEVLTHQYSRQRRLLVWISRMTCISSDQSST